MLTKNKYGEARPCLKCDKSFDTSPRGETFFVMVDFLLQFHDCVSSPVWGMDRIHVGLFICCRGSLHPIFHGYCPRRKSRNSQPFLGFVTQQFFRHGGR